MLGGYSPRFPAQNVIAMRAMVRQAAFLAWTNLRCCLLNSSSLSFTLCDIAVLASFDIQQHTSGATPFLFSLTCAFAILYAATLRTLARCWQVAALPLTLVAERRWSAWCLQLPFFFAPARFAGCSRAASPPFGLSTAVLLHLREISLLSHLRQACLPLPVPDWETSTSSSGRYTFRRRRTWTYMGGVSLPYGHVPHWYSAYGFILSVALLWETPLVPPLTTHLLEGT